MLVNFSSVLVYVPLEFDPPHVSALRDVSESQVRGQTTDTAPTPLMFVKKIIARQQSS